MPAAYREYAAGLSLSQHRVICCLANAEAARDNVQAVFGQAWVEDLTRYSDGRSSSRHVERPRVSIDEWMNALEPGDAWLRVAPVDRGWRQERVRVALPTRIEPSDDDSDIAPDSYGAEIRPDSYPRCRLDSRVVRPDTPEPDTALPPGGGGAALPASAARLPA